MGFSNKYWKDQLIWKKFHADSSSEPQYNTENTIKNWHLRGIKVSCDFLKHLQSYRLGLERKAGTEIHWSPRLQHSEKISENNFALSDAKSITSKPLSRDGVYLSLNFKFHTNLHISSDLICTFPTFYQDIITSWCNYYTSPPTLPSTISSQYLWFNTFIKIGNRVVYYKEFSDNQINYVCDFFDRNGNLKSWVNLVHEYKI